jgi:hypothetical protein
MGKKMLSHYLGVTELQSLASRLLLEGSRRRKRVRLLLYCRVGSFLPCGNAAGTIAGEMGEGGGDGEGRLGTHGILLLA